MDKTTVSIVVPVYNFANEYLIDLIESIKQQKGTVNEIIFSCESNNDIDNLSKLGICPSQLILNKRKQGIFGNLNNAILASTGEFIQILCQDDFLEPEFLYKQVSLLKKHASAALTFSNIKINKNNKIEIVRPNINEKRDQWPQLMESNKALILLFKYGCIPGNLSTVMLRKSIIDEIGLFNENMNYAGDYEYWQRIVTNYPICYNHNAHVIVRDHKERASLNLSINDYLKDMIIVRTKIFSQTNPYNSRLKKLIYENQVFGVQFLHLILSTAILKGDYRSLYLTKLLVRPYNIFLISIIYLTTFKNKFLLLS